MADSECVKLWRDTFKLNLSQSWKSDVDKTVTDVKLWAEILKGWGYWHKGKWKKKSPGIKNLLAEYERREFDKLEAANGNNQASVVSARSRERIPERGNSDVSKVSYQPPSLYFRTRNLVR